MPTVETMTLDEIDAALVALSARRKVLKATSTVAQRKIITLARRRERLMQQVNALDEQIVQLRGADQSPAPPAALGPPRTAGRRSRPAPPAR